MNDRDIVDALLAEHGRTFADDVGIDLDADSSDAVFCLLVAAILFSTRIGHGLAAEAARALFNEGWTSPAKLGDAGWEARTKMLNEAGYARYDESTSRMLGDTCEIAMDRYDGDLLRLRQEADGDHEALKGLVADFKGIGEVGAEIFLREIQAVWTEFAPYVDDRTAEAADDLGLPTSAEKLADLAGDQFPQLVAALVRTTIENDTDRIRAIAAGDEAPSVDADRMTKKELYEQASDLDVSGRSSMSKDELAEAIGAERSDSDD